MVYPRLAVASVCEGEFEGCARFDSYLGGREKPAAPLALRNEFDRYIGPLKEDSAVGFDAGNVGWHRLLAPALEQLAPSLVAAVPGVQHRVPR